MITVFTDGSCNINKTGAKNIGGYAFVVLNSFGEMIHEFVGKELNTTNNRMELMAAISALEYLKEEKDQIVIKSDSKYVVNAVDLKWLDGWKKKGYKKAGKDILNRDLWERMDSLLRSNVTFKWVQGHNGNVYNERCDRLAATVYQPNFKIVNQ